MNGASEADILKAVQSLDEKMGRALQRQTETLSKRIQELSDQHSNARLAQEQRNATFATGQRAEAIAEHLHRIANTVQTVALHQADLKERVTKLEGKGGIAWQRYLAVAAIVSGPTSVVLALILRLSFG